MSGEGVTCSDCGHQVYFARVWDGFAICVRCDNLRVFKHEAETPMRGHDPDGRCCRLARVPQQ